MSKCNGTCHDKSMEDLKMAVEHVVFQFIRDGRLQAGLNNCCGGPVNEPVVTCSYLKSVEFHEAIRRVLELMGLAGDNPPASAPSLSEEDKQDIIKQVTNRVLAELGNVVTADDVREILEGRLKPLHIVDAFGDTVLNESFVA